jgi:FkbM family methyltransferase
MIKFFAFIIFKILNYCDLICKKIIKRSFLIYLNEFISNVSYKSIKILNKNINFYTPNKITEWRVNTFFEKEPETLEWIDSFDIKSNIIFWDIGGNIGLYSIYAALRHSNIEIITFEPSTSNLRVLSRNISLNKLNDKIKICQFPLTDKNNSFLLMKEDSFEEGGALNTFGENYDYNGNIFSSNHQYKIFGTSINYLLDNSILKIPNYIKIDVDGIEHLILQGGNKYLNSSLIKSISIELNENFLKQFDDVHKILKENKFFFKYKKRNNAFYGEKSNKIYNYVFTK